jgi:glycerol-3-phosphate dehydrogenase (NAD(P)+)
VHVHVHVDDVGEAAMTARADTLGIVGAGRFGSALASVVARAGRPVLVWTRDASVAEAIRAERKSPRLPAAELGSPVRVTTDPGELAAGARLIVLAVVSTDARQRARELGRVVDGNHLLVHAVGSLATPGDDRVSEILAQETPALRLGALAGPALPADLAAGQFSSMVIASRFDEVIAEARRLLNTPPALRVYTSHDVVGVELAAALSGAYTVAIGLADALGVGPGPRAVLITRGLAEASRLGAVFGAEARTFAGLAGLGNLLVRSAPGVAARDYDLGQRLAAGTVPPAAEWSEGARAAVAVAGLAARRGVRMPVLRGLAAILTGHASPADAARLAADSVAAEE